jgi:hypothetical protein
MKQAAKASPRLCLVHCRLSHRFEAMFMHSAMRPRNASGEGTPAHGGRAEGEEKPCATWMEKGHGMPDRELLAYRPWTIRDRRRDGEA